ncbi:hypothetical protein OSB04_006600 [Centaurea solstitialis]|uniref:Uncharacterized protein n=1 Tax=Centaurea solstitialis TaxID=347529 RepID=A0AA38WQD6_9ASTR|nr:hypothetical protein OSB04_006600 [Centaurea solstitialis]
MASISPPTFPSSAGTPLLTNSPTQPLISCSSPGADSITTIRRICFLGFPILHPSVGVKVITETTMMEPREEDGTMVFKRILGSGLMISWLDIGSIRRKMIN